MDEEKTNAVLIVDGEGAAFAVVRAIEQARNNSEEFAAVQIGGSSTPAGPSEADILATLQGETCAACGGRKRPDHAFCATDFAALTIFQRRQMSMGLKGERFYEKYRSCLRHLQLNPTRVKQLPVRAGEWGHKSEDDVEAAGYKFLEHARCNVPRCNVRIVWYRTPKGGKIPVNLADYQPHRTSCADPEYLQRKREERAAQTFARRKEKETTEESMKRVSAEIICCITAWLFIGLLVLAQLAPDPKALTEVQVRHAVIASWTFAAVIVGFVWGVLVLLLDERKPDAR